MERLSEAVLDKMDTMTEKELIRAAMAALRNERASKRPLLWPARTVSDALLTRVNEIRAGRWGGQAR